MVESGEPPATANTDGGDKKSATSDNERKPHRNRRNHRNRANKQKWKEGGNENPIHIPKEKFVGRCDDLTGFIYDVVTSKGGVAYTRTTEEIARYVGEKYSTTGHAIRTAILTLKVPVPQRPVAPVADATTKTIDPTDAEIFKQEVRMYVQMRAAITSAMKSLYDLLWGQCSESLRSRLRSFEDYPTYSQNGDSLTLLKGIRAEMTGFRNKQYLSHSLHKTMRDFYSLAQGKQRNNQEYYDEFNSMVLTAEESGATIGSHPGSINDIILHSAVDPENPTELEHVAATKKATDRYLAVAFLLGADRMRYGTLVEEIENEFLRNKGDASESGTYPTSVAEAYDYLCNYKKDPKILSRLLGQNSVSDYNTGVAFIQDGDRQANGNQTQNNSSNGNNTNTNSTQEQTFATNGGGNSGYKKVCRRCGVEGHTSVDCSTSQDKVDIFRQSSQPNQGVSQLIHAVDWDGIVDTSDEALNWTFLLPGVVHEAMPNTTFKSDGPIQCTEHNKNGTIAQVHKSTIFSQANDGVPKTWHLLDNQSTCDIASNPKLVKNIRQVEGHMQLATQAGSTTTNWMADVPGCCRPAWFHPGGTANIPCLVNMIARHHIT
jgi:hypothetical protein